MTILISASECLFSFDVGADVTELFSGFEWASAFAGTEGSLRDVAEHSVLSGGFFVSFAAITRVENIALDDRIDRCGFDLGDHGQEAFLEEVATIAVIGQDAFGFGSEGIGLAIVTDAHAFAGSG